MSTTSSGSTSWADAPAPRATPATVRWCAPCGDDRLFEVPPCEDGHGEECLDLACVECGHAIVVGVLVSDADVLVDVRAA